MRGERLLALLFSVLSLAGCGGSGSSGFDPAGFEMLLIEEAIADRRCVKGRDENALLICPSGATVHDPVGGLPGPAPADMRVVAGFERNGLHCGATDAPSCGLSVAIETAGLPPGAELRLALRVVPDGRWSIGAPLALASADGDGMVVASLEAQLAGDAGPADAVQVAILVFVPPLGDVPPEVDELRETGASYAFVLAPLPLGDGSRRGSSLSDGS